MANARNLASVIGFLCTVASAGAPALALEAGQVVAVWGSLQVERADGDATAGAAASGTTIYVGDRLITGAGDRAKIVLAEHSVVDIAPSTEIVLRRQTGEASAGRLDSLIEVVRGKIRARLEVSAVGSTMLYQVETPTAVVLRGTDFIVVYDAEKAQTKVVGIRDVAEVIGRLAVAGGAVKVGSQEETQVAKGRFPVATKAVPLDEYSAHLQGLTIVGTGAEDGLVLGHPATTGRLLSPRDLPGEPDPAAAVAAGGLVVEAPGDFLADEMSNDVRINDQPLLEYERQQPGLPLPADEGGVIVEF